MFPPRGVSEVKALEEEIWDWLLLHTNNRHCLAVTPGYVCSGSNNKKKSVKGLFLPLLCPKYK